jgi:hypothetical protein
MDKYVYHILIDEEEIVVILSFTFFAIRPGLPYGQGFHMARAP